MRKKSRRNSWHKTALTVLALFTALIIGVHSAPSWAISRPDLPGDGTGSGNPIDGNREKNRDRRPEVVIYVSSDKELYETPEKATIIAEVYGEGTVDLYFKMTIPQTDDSLPFVPYVNQLYIPLAEIWR